MQMFERRLETRRPDVGSSLLNQTEPNFIPKHNQEVSVDFMRIADVVASKELLQTIDFVGKKTKK